MNYDYLIEKYFEGGLEPAEKEILFTELARNPQLREAFEHEMKLINLAQRDYSRIQPPAESMNYVFATLGFKIPNAVGFKTGSSKIPIYGKLQEFFGKAIPYFTLSLLASGITLLLFWFFFNPFSTNVQVANETPKIQATPEITSTTNTNIQRNTQPSYQQSIDYAVLERILNKALEKMFPPQGYESQTRSIDGNATAKLNSFTPELSAQTSMAYNKIYDSKLSEIPSKVIVKNIADINLPAFSSALEATTDLSQYLNNITVSVRGFSLESEPKAKVNYEQKGVFNDVGIGIGYNLGKYSTFGIEFGQEKFPQNFELNLYGELTYYRQNPLLWWYGVYYNQKIPFLFRNETLNPFLQAFLGGTSIGALLRGIIGLQYEPDRRVALFLGWENSLLFYNVQNKIYKTRKNGLTYGVNVRF